MIAAEWGWALPFFAACLTPGACVAAILTRRTRLNAAEFGAVAFALSVALFSAIAIVVWLAGGSLGAVTVVYLAATAGLVAWFVAWRRSLRGPGARVDGGWSGLALAAGAGILAMVERPWFFSSSDSFYHVAAVRSLVRSGAVFVTDPIYGTTPRYIDPTSGIWHSMQAAFARPLGIEPTTLFLPVLGLGAFVLVASIWALLRRVTGHDRVADAMTLAWLTMLYGLDLRACGYPNEVTLGLGLLFAALLARSLEERDAAPAVLAGIVGFATVTTHLGGAEFIGLLGAAFVLWALVIALVSRRSKDAVPAHTALFSLLALGLAFVPALPVIVPRYLALRGSLVIGQETAALIAREVVRLPGGIQIMLPGYFLGPVWVYWIGLACCGWALVRSRRAGATVVVTALAVGTLPFLLLTDPLVAPLILGYSAHMARKLASLLHFAPWVGVAWAAGAALAGSKGARTRLLAVAAVIASYALASVMLLGYYPDRLPAKVPTSASVVGAWARDRRVFWGPENLATVRKAMSEAGTPVIAGPLQVVYQVTGVADVRALAVVEAHSPYDVESVDGPQRRSDDMRLVDPDTPEAERYALAQKWGVDCLVFDDTPEYLPAREKVLADARYFEPVVVTGRLTVVRVKR